MACLSYRVARPRHCLRWQVLVVDGVESDRAPAAGSAAPAMALLVIGFWDHGLDAAGAEVPADRAGRVCLVGSDRVRPGAWSSPLAAHAQLLHQRQEHRRVARLPRGDQRDQRAPVTVDELVDLRRQAASGTTDAVVRRLFPQILVTRSTPL